MTTDTLWSERLANIVPANFSDNRTTTFTATANLIEDMINMIGRTVITGQPSAYNPFDIWTQPVMDYGDTIQEYTLPYIVGKKFDPNPDDPNPYVTVKQEAKPQYWKINDSVQYKQTLYNYEVKKAFTNADTFGNFTSTIMANMYSSIGIDKYTKWLKYLSTTNYLNATNGIKSIVADTSTDTGQDAYGLELWKTIKKLVKDDLKYPSSDYNAMGFLTSSPAVDVVITTDAKLMMDNALAGVYNVEQIVPPGLNFIEVGSFATVEGQTGTLDAIILSKDMCKYTPRTPESTSLYNPENLNTNIWYTEQGVYSIDYSKNAVQIYRGTATVNEGE